MKSRLLTRPLAVLALCCLSLGIGVGIGYAGSGVSQWDWFQATGNYQSTTTYTEIDSNEIHMTNSADHIRMVGGDDIIWMADGDDIICMGPTATGGMDTITFNDGDALFEFHDADIGDGKGDCNFKYTETNEDLTLTCNGKLIIRLGS